MEAFHAVVLLNFELHDSVFPAVPLVHFFMRNIVAKEPFSDIERTPLKVVFFSHSSVRAHPRLHLDSCVFGMYTLHGAFFGSTATAGMCTSSFLNHVFFLFFASSTEYVISSAGLGQMMQPSLLSETHNRICTPNVIFFLFLISPSCRKLKKKNTSL